MEDLASQQDTMEIMDSSLYYKAARGEIGAFKQYDSEGLKQLVTRFDKNTILHIHITARCRFSSYPYLYYVSIKDEALRDRDRSETDSVDFVKNVLRICPDLLYQQNAKDETLLHIAARHGHEDIVKILADENERICQEDQEAARQMLRMVNKVKDSALHEAVRYGHLEVVKELIKRDRDYSCGVNDAGETPLYLAAEKGFSMAVDQMLEAGNSPAYQGPDDRTALHAAVIRQDKELTNKIKDKMSFLATKADKQGWLPLHYAAKFGCHSIVKILLDADESAAYIANKIDEKTPLHLAAENGHYHIMKELISRCSGCWEQVDAKGRNVLHHAVESKNEFAVMTILNDTSLSNLINEKDKDGNTALHLQVTSTHYWKDFIGHPKVDRHAFNNRNLNPLDVLLSQDYFGLTQKKIIRELELLGTKSCQRIVHREESNKASSKIGDYKIIVMKEVDREESNKASSKIGGDKIIVTKEVDREESNKASSKIGNDMIIVMKEAREAHLVVVTLIATVTFAAGFTLPGGYNSDENDPEQGHAILTKDLAFKAFVVSDTIALMLSSSAVFYHLFMRLQTRKKNLVSMFDHALILTSYALVAMVVAFMTGTYAVLSHCSGLAIAAATLCFLFLFHFIYSFLAGRLVLFFLERIWYMKKQMMMRIPSFKKKC